MTSTLRAMFAAGVFLVLSNQHAMACDQNTPLPAPEERHDMTIDEFKAAAKVKFHRCHHHISESKGVPSTFRANLDFPTTLPDASTLPWKDVHPIEQPEEFLDVVLDYAMAQCGGDEVDWDGTQCGWFHAPWMHDLREPMHGLTRERSSRLGELHPSQTMRTGNWAVSLYNDIGGYGFHRIWGEDKAFPKTDGFAFDDGTMAVKLLFSLATPEQVPYLRHAKTWKIYDGQDIVDARLLQIDVLVKDDRVVDGANRAPNDDLTGWVMGSYLYNGAIETFPRCDQVSNDVEACEQARWRDRLIPIGVQWGNDPQIYDGSSTDVLHQHWLNNVVSRMFAPLRSMSGHPPHLGRDGRMNGPVDNHRSSCLACHGRAVDFGRYEEDALRLVPFIPFDYPRGSKHNGAQLAELQRFFRNLNSNEPFLPGAQSLDYSLQAAVGLHHYRKWVDELPLSLEEKAMTVDFEPSYTSPDPVEGELKLVTWNISNLHHENKVPLRSGAPAREQIDFERLAAKAEELDGDIYALQEAGSPVALARIFPPDKFHFVMSDRYERGDEENSPDKRDIFMAFAISRDVFPKVPKVETVKALSVTHLQWDNKSAVDQERPTRSGISVEFEYDGDKYAVLNVHLKSSCAGGKLLKHNEVHSKSFKTHACRTLVAQLEMLENWFEQHHALGYKVILLGDFNRHLNWTEAKKTDDFWEDLNDGDPIKLVKGPADSATDCWQGNTESRDRSIDYIVLGQNVLPEGQAPDIKKIDYGFGDETEFPEYAGKKFHKISDHCPVVLTLRR